MSGAPVKEVSVDELNICSGYLYTNSLCALIAAWLNASLREIKIVFVQTDMPGSKVLKFIKTGYCTV